MKCNPEQTTELREHHEEILPGWHMNKEHWNTVSFEGNLSLMMIKQLIDHSYELIVKGLNRKQKENFIQCK